MNDKMRKPMISIIVPIYNVEKYLKRCIDSILNQIFTDFELILVNDGSVDNCGKICNEYSKKDNRIKVIHNENGGLSSARNTGLDIARGEYIGFVDSDDFISKSMYQKLFTSLQNNNSDISVCAFKSFINDIEVYDKFDFYEYNYSNFEYIEQLYNGNNNVVVAWNKLYKRELFNDIRYPEGRIYEDAFIIHKILYKAKKITFIDCKLYYYYLRENSIMRSNFNKKKFDSIMYHNDRSKFFKKLGMYKYYYMSQGAFIGEFFRLYYKGKQEECISYSDLKKIKDIFKKEIINIFLVKNYSFREKISWIIFLVNEDYYEKRFYKSEVLK